MRVTYFLLPVLHPRGATYDPCHQEARGRLLRTYGGYTQSIVEGAWRNPAGRAFTNTSVRYEIAREWTVYEQNTLRHTIIELGELAHQECMLVGWPTGEIELIQCDAHRHDDDRFSASNTVAWAAAEAERQRTTQPVAHDYAERAIDAIVSENGKHFRLPVAPARTPHRVGGYPRT
jgi:hypothetical protein